MDFEEGTAWIKKSKSIAGKRYIYFMDKNLQKILKARKSKS